MFIFPSSRLIASTVAAVCLAGVGPVAYAQDADIQTIYSTEKGACGAGPEMRVEITEGRIIGPDFDCALSGGRPAGTGLVAYDGNCTVDGNTTPNGPALDLGNYDDHFELSLPGHEDWIKLYPCTP